EIAAVALHELTGVFLEDASPLPPLQLGILVDAQGIRRATDMRKRAVHGNNRCHVPLRSNARKFPRSRADPHPQNRASFCAAQLLSEIGSPMTFRWRPG